MPGQKNPLTSVSGLSQEVEVKVSLELTDEDLLKEPSTAAMDTLSRESVAVLRELVGRIGGKHGLES